GQLSVVILGGVQRDIEVSEVVAEVCRKSEYRSSVLLLEGSGQAEHRQISGPGPDAIFAERIFREFFDGFRPVLWQHPKRAVSIDVQIDEVLFRFALYSISSLVGIDGFLCNEVNMRFIKRDHLRRKRENRLSIDQ